MTGHVYFSKKRYFSEPRVGEIYKVKGTLINFEKSKNPYAFDYAEYLKNSRISFRLIEYESTRLVITSYSIHYTKLYEQYEALKNKLREYPDTKFIVWTGAALVKNATDEPKALRAKEFFNWVINDWDEPGDNIFLWDFYDLQTEGGLYFKDEYAAGKKDSHPNRIFSAQTAPLFCNRIIDVVNNKGELTELTGKHLSLTEE